MMIRIAFHSAGRAARLAVAWLLMVAVATAQSSEADLLESIREQGDKTPHSVFEDLGRLGTGRAFEALEEGLDEVRRYWSKRAIFHAMRHFLDDPRLGGRALVTIKRYARSDDETEAQAAAGALAGFGDPATDTLFEIAEGAKDPGARAHAVRGLRSQLVERGDEESLALLIDNWKTPASGSREEGIAAVRAFTSPEALQRLERFVVSRKASFEVQRMVLVALGGHRRGEDEAFDEGVDGVLERALQAPGAALRYHALVSIAQRGGTASEKRVERLVQDRDPTVRRAAILALMRFDLAGVELGDLAADPDPVRRQAAAIGLAEDPSEEALADLHRLLRDEDPTVRAEAIHQTARRRERDSIPVLIQRLAAEKGRLKGDVRFALTMLTGKDLRYRVGAWQMFWRTEGETFEVPTLAAAREAAAERETDAGDGDTRVAFYGLDVISNRFALVVDTSGSMKEKAYGGKRRIQVAKEQLTRTIERLRDGALFNVIPFSSAARPLHDGLAEMGDGERERALTFVGALRPRGDTNVYDALAAAFDDPRIDTIYLLTDGDPTVGEIVESATLRDEIARWNSVRGIRIHCIAVGRSSPLLEGIAEDSGGVYRQVN